MFGLITVLASCAALYAFGTPTAENIGRRAARGIVIASELFVCVANIITFAFSALVLLQPWRVITIWWKSQRAKSPRQRFRGIFGL